MNIEPCMWCREPWEGSVIIESDLRIDVFHPEYWVSCIECDARGPAKDTKEKAIEAWNEVARIVRDAKEGKNI